LGFKVFSTHESCARLSQEGGSFLHLLPPTPHTATTTAAAAHQGLYLAPIPQSLELTGSGPDILSQWGINTINVTAGDLLRLAPSQPRLTLHQPLLLAGDIHLTGVAPNSSRTAGAGRHLLQQAGRLELVCDGQQQQNTSALRIR
jgi:hypothetical protein